MPVFSAAEIVSALQASGGDATQAARQLREIHASGLYGWQYEETNFTEGAIGDVTGNKVVTINLAAKQIDDDDMYDLAQIIRSRTEGGGKVILNLANNKIKKGLSELFKENSLWDTLYSLDLSGNELKQESIDALGNFLAGAKALKDLNISRIKTDNLDLWTLVNGLAQNESLKERAHKKARKNRGVMPGVKLARLQLEKIMRSMPREGVDLVSDYPAMLLPSDIR